MKKSILFMSIGACLFIFSACFSETNSTTYTENIELEAAVSNENLSGELSIANSSGNAVSDSMKEALQTDFAILKTDTPLKKQNENLLILEIKGENLKGYLFQSIRKSKSESMFAVSGMKFILEKDSNGNFLSSEFYLEDMIKEIENEKVYTISVREIDYNSDKLLAEITTKKNTQRLNLLNFNKKNMHYGEKRIFTETIANKPKLKQVPLHSKRWSEDCHKSMTSLCTSQLGLSTARIKNIEEASFMPDIYQNGASNGYNQQWSHAYMISSWGKHIWGDADDDFNDNLIGIPGKDCEGYKNSSAAAYYAKNNQFTGDQYLGYAIHYIEDASLTLHSSFPSFTATDLLSKHFAYENWVNNNLIQGLFLLEDAFNDYYYYEVNDLKQAIHNTAYLSSVWTSELGEKIWAEYRKCDYPENSGQGSNELADLTKQLIVQTTRYTKGAIIYTLDHFDQWENLY
jgi:hypothetical protein